MNFGTSKEDEQFGCGDDAGYGNDYQQSKRRAMFEGQQPCAPVNSGRYRKDLWIWLDTPVALLFLLDTNKKMLRRSLCNLKDSSRDDWQPVATLILEASYEAT